MPPPNVTGELHIGHAMFVTLEDILCRWHRMMGEPTLWVPGRDHAGIAGQLVVERYLKEQSGLTRHDLGREAFLDQVWEWMDTYGKRIRYQLYRLGASADWDRECFTMDEGPALAVRTAFVRLYERGLIYKGSRITNWCPDCRTVLSDLEVEHREVNGTLTYFKYPLVPAPSADDGPSTMDDGRLPWSMVHRPWSARSARQLMISQRPLYLAISCSLRSSIGCSRSGISRCFCSPHRAVLK
jgi:valyl-tRNA synthetase